MLEQTDCKHDLLIFLYENGEERPRSKFKKDGGEMSASDKPIRISPRSDNTNGAVKISAYTKAAYFSARKRHARSPFAKLCKYVFMPLSRDDIGYTSLLTDDLDNK